MAFPLAPVEMPLLDPSMGGVTFYCHELLSGVLNQLPPKVWVLQVSFRQRWGPNFANLLWIPVFFEFSEDSLKVGGSPRARDGKKTHLLFGVKPRLRLHTGRLGEKRKLFKKAVLNKQKFILNHSNPHIYLKPGARKR